MSTADGAAEKLTPDPTAYGQPISAERQAELQGRLDTWNALGADHGQRRSPFDSVALTGAEVGWLADQSGRNASSSVPNLHLEGARLRYAHLEGANLSEAHLEGARLRGGSFEAKTNFAGASLLEEKDPRAFRARLLRRPRYGPALGDIRWGNFDLVQLTQLEGWGQGWRLVDERDLGPLGDLDAHEQAIRAYRQVAARLRDQGSASDADRLAERAQIRQRKLHFARLVQDWRCPWRWPGDLLRWLGSMLLALISGYGYRPIRSLITYILVILTFAGVYYSLGPTTNLHLTPAGAIATSMVSFHGRGFFPGQLDVDGIFMRFVAAEALCGLRMEITFIAPFTQRFFGAK